MRWYLCLLGLCWNFLCNGQDETPSPPGQQPWTYMISVNSYAFHDALIINPVVTADHDHLHLEARYNYEDTETFSFFAGYTFEMGNAFSVELTPMAGYALGRTDGIIPALELNLEYGAFGWYSESEYLLNTGDGDDFFYAWSEVTYHPVDWLMIGLAGARTRLYNTDLSVQRGFGLGYEQDRWGVTAYLMNLGFDQPFFYFSISINLP